MDQLGALALGDPRGFARALARAATEITRRSPAPRERPFFALDHPAGTATKLLDRLSELGIFRHYEHVLDVGAGLGGPARWLARRRGCSVVSVDRSRDRAVANGLLVRRAHLTSQVSVAAAAFEQLPAGDGAFTHAWSVETLHREADKRSILAEMFRAIRPGGHLALQEWTLAQEETGAGGGYQPVDGYVASLRAVGFVEVRAEAVAELREEPSAVSEVFRDRVAEILDEDPGVRAPLDEPRSVLEAHAAAIAGGRVALVQIFASRPA